MAKEAQPEQKEAKSSDEQNWRLYEIVIDEEHYFLRLHQTRTAFYSGFLTALATLTAAGIMKSSEWHEFAFVGVGPLLLFGIAAIAIKGTRRSYLSFLEAVATRAKIERTLELTRQRAPLQGDQMGEWCASEPIVPTRHLESRGRHLTSQSFVAEHMNKGVQLWTERLFQLFQVVSVLGLAAVAYLATRAGL